MKLNLSNLESFIHNLKFLPNTWPKLSFLLRGIYHNHKNYYKYKESKIGNRRKTKERENSEVLFDQKYFHKKTLPKGD